MDRQATSVGFLEDVHGRVRVRFRIRLPLELVAELHTNYLIAIIVLLTTVVTRPPQRGSHIVT